ncbi:antibiotic biosynthesis monooxygenase [Streptomyces sp. NPDC000880]
MRRGACGLRPFRAQPTRTRTHLVEVYRDEQAVAAHRETPHYARWAKASEEFLAEPHTVVQVRGVLPLNVPS